MRRFLRIAGGSGKKKKRDAADSSASVPTSLRSRVPLLNIERSLANDDESECDPGCAYGSNGGTKKGGSIKTRLLHMLTPRDRGVRRTRKNAAVYGTNNNNDNGQEDAWDLKRRQRAELASGTALHFHSVETARYMGSISAPIDDGESEHSSSSSSSSSSLCSPPPSHSSSSWSVVASPLSVACTTYSSSDGSSYEENNNNNSNREGKTMDNNVWYQALALVTIKKLVCFLQMEIHVFHPVVYVVDGCKPCKEGPHSDVLRQRECTCETA
jgi:hypothetical protein